MTTAVNEAGQLIVCNGDDTTMYITAGGTPGTINIGEDTDSNLYGQVEAVIAAWGSETISDFSDGGNGWFVLPAKDGKEEQKYQMSNKVVSPTIANYAG